MSLSNLILSVIQPAVLSNTLLYVFVTGPKTKQVSDKFQINLKLKNGKFQIHNVKRGVSVIGAAGSGKTQSVIYNLLQHFSNNNFTGVIHDYKDYELTEIAYPLFKDSKPDFYTVSFEQIVDKVNPIAPRYMDSIESVNETATVILENLLEQKRETLSGSSKFFNDAVEGLLSGLIWKMKTDHPKYCTLPHLIAIFYLLDTKQMLAFLSSDSVAKNLAGAFISGMQSERQTAGVQSSLANAFKKITSHKIFMTLSKDEVPLDINHKTNQAVVSVVNHPKYESSYSPVIACIIHTITKQMSVRNRLPAFLLMEEAPTIKLPLMQRIPATLRSYDIATVYVMQDKIQNDLIYGEKASKAILSNLSYQFFGKSNDPDTSKYYERFFEIIKTKSTSVNRSLNLNLDTRVTKSDKDVSKRRADSFFRLHEGEFIAFADGKDMKLEFEFQKIYRQRPPLKNYSNEDFKRNYDRIFAESRKLLTDQNIID